VSQKVRTKKERSKEVFALFLQNQVVQKPSKEKKFGAYELLGNDQTKVYVVNSAKLGAWSSFLFDFERLRTRFTTLVRLGMFDDCLFKRT
jgi:hypothetical protein